MRTYTAVELGAMPTLHTGHTDNLKVESDVERVWLCRCGVEDGMAYNNQITHERLEEGRWTVVAEYPG